jgi:hypothetical protein
MPAERKATLRSYIIRREAPERTASRSSARPIETTPQSATDQDQDQTFEDALEEEQDPTSPNTMSDNQEVPTNRTISAADLLAIVQAQQQSITRLEAMMRQSMTPSDQPQDPDREVTPAESAFGGTAFRPSGLATRPEFAKIELDENGQNRAYNDKARSRAKDPFVFEGKPDTFERWVVAVANKFEDDLPTFRTERSRMNYLMNLVTGDPAEALRIRHASVTTPFTSVAEMIQVLETAYYDRTQGVAARSELARMKFTPSKDANIHQFLNRFNLLAQRANVAQNELKSTLWEHLPAHWDSRLLGDSRNPEISYEKFCGEVANAAYVNQRAYEERQAKQAHRAKGSQTGTPQTRKPTKVSARPGRILTEAEKKVHWDAGTCFICGKSGHKSMECPSRTPRPQVNAVKTQQQDVNVQSDEEDSGKGEGY